MGEQQGGEQQRGPQRTELPSPLPRHLPCSPWASLCAPHLRTCAGLQSSRRGATGPASIAAGLQSSLASVPGPTLQPQPPARPLSPGPGPLWPSPRDCRTSGDTEALAWPRVSPAFWQRPNRPPRAQALPTRCRGHRAGGTSGHKSRSQGQEAPLFLEAPPGPSAVHVLVVIGSSSR